MLLAFGVVCALLEAQRSGEGQVVDAAMVDGCAVLMTMFWGMQADRACSTRTRRGTNLLDTGAHFYDVYRCADGKYISVGSIEPQFYAELLRLTGLSDDPEFASADGPRPVAGAQGPPREAVPHEDPRRVVRAHGAHRRVLRAGAHHERGGRASAQRRPRAPSSRSAGIAPAGARAALQPRPGAEVARPPAHPGQHTREVLLDWGLAADDVDELFASGAVEVSAWPPSSASTPIPTTRR